MTLQTSLPLHMQSVEASVDGVLGGYGHVSSADIVESEAFLKETYGARLADRSNEPLRALGQSFCTFCRTGCPWSIHVSKLFLDRQSAEHASNI